MTKQVGEVAYEIDMLPRSRIHNVFHVSCLQVLGQQVTTAVDLLPLDDEGHLVLAILESRVRRVRNRTIREFLVRWKNLSLRMPPGRVSTYWSTRL